MKNQEDELTYDELDSFLSRRKAIATPSRAHGLFTGIVCVLLHGLVLEKDENYHQNWLSFLSVELGVDNLDGNEVEKWLKQIEEKFFALNFEFGPILPDEDVGVAPRLDALTNWCNGFVCGLGFLGEIEESLKSEISKEAFKDLAQVAYSEYDVNETEEDDGMLIEILEYIKVAVQTIQMELISRSDTDLNQEDLDTILH